MKTKREKEIQRLRFLRRARSESRQSESTLKELLKKLGNRWATTGEPSGKEIVVTTTTLHPEIEKLLELGE